MLLSAYGTTVSANDLLERFPTVISEIQTIYDQELQIKFDSSVIEEGLTMVIDESSSGQETMSIEHFIDNFSPEELHDSIQQSKEYLSHHFISLESFMELMDPVAEGDVTTQTNNDNNNNDHETRRLCKVVGRSCTPYYSACCAKCLPVPPMYLVGVCASW